MLHSGIFSEMVDSSHFGWNGMNWQLKLHPPLMHCNHGVWFIRMCFVLNFHSKQSLHGQWSRPLIWFLHEGGILFKNLVDLNIIAIRPLIWNTDKRKTKKQWGKNVKAWKIRKFKIWRFLGHQLSVMGSYQWLVLPNWNLLYSSAHQDS